MTNTTTNAAASPAGAAAQPDFAAIKERQKAVWNAGDYAVLGGTLQIVGELLCEAIDLRAGENVLDVAAGNGNASLAAARRWAAVTSTDYVEQLLEKGRARAAANGMPIEFKVADAENLPFDDASFDVTLSTFGVMFAPNQDRAASELLRVTRPGGRIGLANWTPTSLIGTTLKTVGKYVPPPPGLKPPLLWGTEPRIVELFGPAAADIKVQRRDFVFRYRSARHWLDVFTAYYGPLLKAIESLDESGRAALLGELEALLGQSNRSGSDSLVAPSEYLEIVITRA